MSRILLVDTNISSLPIYSYLIKDNEVYVVGGNPEDYLAKTAKSYVNIDYSEVSQIRELIDHLRIDYIVPGCNDLSYQVCSELNTEKKFPGLDNSDATSIINNKSKFRAFNAALGIPSPRVISLNEINGSNLKIIKPVDAYSGRGVTIIHKYDDKAIEVAVQKAKNYSRSKDYIIEEYIEGQLYSHSAFIVEGKISNDFIVAEYGTANPFVVDTSYLVEDFPKEILEQIRKWIELMVRELKLTDGLIHTQFIKRQDKFWFIEITRRCPGDLYSLLIEKSTGYKYSEAYTRPFLNEPPYEMDTFLETRKVLRHTISLPSEGVFGSIKFKYPAKVDEYFSLTTSGSRIDASPFGRVGLLFLISESKKEFELLKKATLERELYDLSPN